MDRLPITPLHRRAVVVIGLGQFFDLYEIFPAGVLSSVLASQFEWPACRTRDSTDGP
jgi:putative MFS transporter